jgi:hypothetical protein
MYKNLFNLFFILLVAAAVLASGCGKKDNTSSGDQTGDTKTEEQKKEEPKTESKTNELGITEGLPNDYPADIPQPKNSKVLGSLNTSEGTVVTFESGDKPKEIINEFAEGLEKNGYKKADGEMMKDDGGMAIWNKDKKEVSIMLAWDKDKNISSIVITYK